MQQGKEKSEENIQNKFFEFLTSDSWYWIVKDKGLWKYINWNHRTLNLPKCRLFQTYHQSLFPQLIFYCRCPWGLASWQAHWSEAGSPAFRNCHGPSLSYFSAQARPSRLSFRPLSTSTWTRPNFGQKRKKESHTDCGSSCSWSRLLYPCRLCLYSGSFPNSFPCRTPGFHLWSFPLNWAERCGCLQTYFHLPLFCYWRRLPADFMLKKIAHRRFPISLSCLFHGRRCSAGP